MTEESRTIVTKLRTFRQTLSDNERRLMHHILNGAVDHANQGESRLPDDELGLELRMIFADEAPAQKGNAVAVEPAVETKPELRTYGPRVAVIFSDNSVAYESAPEWKDPKDIGGGMVERGKIEFPRGINTTLPGRALLQMNFYAVDPDRDDIIHISANLDGVDITTGTSGPGQPPADIFDGDHIGPRLAKIVNLLPIGRLREGILYFKDANPTQAIFLLLLDAVPTGASTSKVLAVTASDDGGSDSKSYAIHE
jgi:hypothetical protein